MLPVARDGDTYRGASWLAPAALYSLEGNGWLTPGPLGQGPENPDVQRHRLIYRPRAAALAL